MSKRKHVDRMHRQVALTKSNYNITRLPAESKANALVKQAKDHLAAKQDVAAIKALTAALKADPLHIEALILQAKLMMKYGKKEQAINMMQTSLLRQPEDANNTFLYARWLAEAGRTRLALAAMHRCLQLNPNNDSPRRYLAALYGSLGFEEHSQFWAEKAVRMKAFTLRLAKVETKLTVLTLNTEASGSLAVGRKNFNIQVKEGHNNLASLLDKEHISLISFRVDTVDSQSGLLSSLPEADLIYNAITDPERCEHALHLAQQVCDKLKLPVINLPKAVLAASREGNYARFKDDTNIIVPKSIRFENTQQKAKVIVEQAMHDHGFELPVIIRLAGFQGGKFMHKIDDLVSHDFSELDNKLNEEPQTVYVIQYHDVSYVDERLASMRLYPKYRAFLVAGKLYPCHLFIANHFNVHRSNSKQLMIDHPWLVDQEKAYLDDPVKHFGINRWRTLEKALIRTGLDYCGVDFALNTELDRTGQLVIFEANPAMRNWIAELPEGDPVQQAWVSVTKAVHNAFVEAANIEPWPFEIPKGLSGEILSIPKEVKCEKKKVLPDHATSNHIWMADRLGEWNDFSNEPFFNTRYFIDEELLEHTARQQNIRVQRYPERMLEFTQGQQQVVFHINSPRIPMDVHIMEKDKVLMKKLFAANGIPTPEAEAFTNFDAAYRYFASRIGPQVVKPAGGFASRGVSVHITTPEQFQAAWKKAIVVSKTVLVEDMIQGEELRVYFIGGEYIGATVRTPAFIIGDGKSTIEQLIEAKNRDRSKNPIGAKAPIIDTPALVRNGRSRNDIPEAGRWLVLGDSHIIAQGAESIAIVDGLPDAMIASCQNAARLLPSTVCGVDLFIEDLAKPKAYWITEVNASTPAISGLFHFPCYGQPKAVASRLLEYAFKYLAQTTQLSKVSISPAKLCKQIPEKSGSFVTDHLQILACMHNLPVQRLKEDTLLIGSPAKLGWTQNMSTRTTMESVQVLKHKEWFGARLKIVGVTNSTLSQGTEVRILVAGEHLLAAHAKTKDGWKDVTETLHIAVADVIAKIMAAIYRPGHALITLAMAEPNHAPDKDSWGILSVNLQPDLLMFYKNVDQSRDVVSAIFAELFPNFKGQVSLAISKQILIIGKVQGVGYRKWIKLEIARHALTGLIRNLANGSVEVVVNGQPNAIAALVIRCKEGPVAAVVRDVIVNHWDGEAPKGIEII